MSAPGMKRLAELAEQLDQVRLGLVGDLVADLYLYGEPCRLSREAPVLVARYQGEEMIPGGGANTVLNLLALGATVRPVGVVGTDDLGRALAERLRAAGARPEGLLALPGVRTLAKTRVMLGEQHRTRHQTIRIDREDQGELPDDLPAQLLAALETADREVDAWIVSDYGYATLGAPAVRKRLVELAATKPVVVDSRYRLDEFAGVTAVTPNHREALELVARPGEAAPDLVELGRLLRRRLKVKAALITLGREGMALFAGKGGPDLIPAAGAQEAVDVTGAGDTVAAAFAGALAAGGDFAAAARLANYAASVVVMKPNAATLSPAELAAAIASDG